jgi:pyridoxal/pyridoxine/pyridoxamine kinase
MITGIDPGDGFVTTLAGDRNGRWRVGTPKLALRPTGTGDVFSAAFLHAVLHGADTPAALERGVETVFDLMETAHRTGARELDPAGFAPRPGGGASAVCCHAYKQQDQSRLAHLSPTAPG